MSTTHLKGARRVIGILRDAGHEAYLAGGCVRDHLLGLEPADLDIATSATPDEVEALFHRTMGVGKAFGVILVRLGGAAFEVATFRSDGEYRDGRRPESVTFADAETDVRRRDFTVNGLLWDPADDRILDFVGGRDDLDARCIRAIGDPEQRFQEDALRLLRAVRFASLWDFGLESGTEAAVRRLAATIGRVSAERIRDELGKIATYSGIRRGDAWRLLVRTGLASEIFELPFADAQAESHARTLDALELRTLPGFLAVILREAAAEGSPPATWRRIAESVALRLRCSGEEQRLLQDLLGDRPRYRGLLGLSRTRLRLAATRRDRATHEDLLRAEGDGTDILEALAASRARDGATLPAPLISGKDLLAAGFRPGPGLGTALRQVRVLQLRNELGDAASALAWLRDRAASS